MTADWAQAACRNSDLELWFPEGYDSNLRARQEKEARRICRSCPIQLACLQLALDNEKGVPGRYRYGTFGGLNGRERRKLDTTDDGWEDHGTPAAYKRHYRAKEAPCKACRDAHLEYRHHLDARAVGDQHGTYTGYTKGCRCYACRAASAEYHREYRQRESA